MGSAYLFVADADRINRGPFHSFRVQNTNGIFSEHIPLVAQWMLANALELLFLRERAAVGDQSRAWVEVEIVELPLSLSRRGGWRRRALRRGGLSRN